ncbi:hypothetical protein BDN71DRAFT_1594822 [Pleurotus eryngii]|uniref:Uncharacterized protein n=1 Tax=Pleurotus eryngii TaxID=5323 RepID=A0A9P5ZEL7_PLEER|nr:hypothetical protein BDN71DRAFT_1594822 [Pleurotus eryngii]
MKDILHRKPFLQGMIGTPSVELDRHPLGDNVLWEVTHVVLFGHGGPGITGTPPLCGFQADDVALAAFFIILALDEWSDGLMKPITLNLDLLNDDLILRDLGLKLSAIKAKHEDEWVQLSTDIFFFNHRALPSQNTTDLTRGAMDILGIS